MARYAMVQDASGIVVNVIVWSGDIADWQPPAGYTMVLDDKGEAGIGFSYVDGVFTPPPSGEPGTASQEQQP